MSMSDPVADLLTRIRNAVRRHRAHVDVPHSGLKEGIVRVLEREGYVASPQVLPLTEAHRVLRVHLRYGQDGEPIINRIDRASRPGRRLYAAAAALPKPQNGLGICVVSTSAGVMSDREARAKNLGGEVLATLW